MLQQTQVVTVIDYYHRFIEKFPTLVHLAEATEQEVLTLWSGLGYYSRARNLQKAAQKIVQEYQSIFPKDPEEILKLPGIGPYTRGAIASIAYDLPVALVDGNVIRVYSRLLALAGSPSDAKFVKKIWEIAEEVMKKLRTLPSDFNQALMELGATTCTPKNPSCLICPVQKNCEGRVLGPENFPEKKKRSATKELTRRVWVLLDKDNKISLRNDPETRWHKGLWQLPSEWSERVLSAKFDQGHTQEKSSLPVHQFISLPPFTHHITHHKIKVFPYFIQHNSPLAATHLSDTTQKFTLSEALALALPAPDKKILKNLATFLNK